MKKIIMLLAIVFIFVISSFSAFACSCIMPGTVAEEVERADAVFLGTVDAVGANAYGKYVYNLAIEYVYNPAIEYVYEPVIVTFAVQEYWKGVFSEPLVIQTGQGDGDCGYPFEEGKEYLVYAYADENDDLHANICSRTALVSDAEKDLATLGKGFVPEETVSSEKNSFNIFVAILILSLISFVLLVTYTKKKK